MPIPISELQGLIQNAFPNAQVAVDDLVGDGDHLQAIIVADAFEGKTLLEQHQMVYDSLGDLLKAQLHALALKTYTPKEWEKYGSK